MNKLPLARNVDLVVQQIDNELLIYDLQTNKALCLNETAKIVFNACDGKTSFESLQQQNNQINDGIIQLTLEKLSKENLLAEPVEFDLPRRTLLKKAALTAIALPIISVVIAPIAIEALSTSCSPAGIACVDVPDCCAGLGCQNVANLGVMCCTPPGGNCTFPRPDLCCSGCCTAVGAPPGSQICC
jgi:hypothetical protein